MKVRNSDIYFARGEHMTLGFSAFTANGAPFIMPPLVDILTIESIGSLEFADGTKPEPKYSEKIGYYYDLSGNKTTLRLNNNKFPIEFHYITSATTIFGTIYFGDNTNTVNTLASNGSWTVTSPSQKLYTHITFETTGEFYLTGAILKVPVNNTINNVALAIGRAKLGIAAFTVRPVNYDNLVLTKYLNLTSVPVYDGKPDYSPGGYCKFTTQELKELSSPLTLDVGISDIEDGNVYVYHYRTRNIEIGSPDYGKTFDIYQHMCYTDNGWQILPYTFELTVPLVHKDTAHLNITDYKYDVILYTGTEAHGDNIDFPLSYIDWKRELVSPHKFVMEDTNNE
ncbi:MAG: hypothetical protein IKU15_00090 [Clostridia bacterium]|nr:hypothetical protein [Clostridia bacterium]